MSSVATCVSYMIYFRYSYCPSLLRGRNKSVKCATSAPRPCSICTGRAQAAVCSSVSTASKSGKRAPLSTRARTGARANRTGTKAYSSNREKKRLVLYRCLPFLLYLKYRSTKRLRPDLDSHMWPFCHQSVPHQMQSLLLTQIISGDNMFKLKQDFHS